MSVRIGMFGRTKDATEGLPGSHVALFNYANVRDTRLRSFVVGYARYTAADLIAARKRGWRLDARVFGVCRFTEDVTPHLANETVARLRVTGWLRAPSAIRAHLRSAR